MKRIILVIAVLALMAVSSVTMAQGANTATVNISLTVANYINISGNCVTLSATGGSTQATGSGALTCTANILSNVKRTSAVVPTGFVLTSDKDTGFAVTEGTNAVGTTVNYTLVANPSRMLVNSDIAKINGLTSVTWTIAVGSL